MSAFVLSELKTALVIAVKVYIPFLVIDIVVANVLLGMGMMVLPPIIISLPFKLMICIDGWLEPAGSVDGSRLCGVRGVFDEYWRSHFVGPECVVDRGVGGGPMLLAALVVGAFISILQAVTQVHEMTLVFVPKIAAVCRCCWPWEGGCWIRQSSLVDSHLSRFSTFLSS